MRGPFVVARCGPVLIALCVFTLLVVGGCTREQAVSCPGQFDPDGLSEAELTRENFGRIPEHGATTPESVRATITQRRGWIKENYAGVVDVAIGEGWGVTHARDQYGNITYHHDSDHMIVTTVDKRANCPDPERGTLLIFGPDKLRVPVWFVYRPS